MDKTIEKALKLRQWVSIQHHIPGRIRLKYKLGVVAQLAGFNHKDIERALDEIPALRSYKVNAVTNSILIEYNAEAIAPSTLENVFADELEKARCACEEIASYIENNGV